MDEGDVEMLDRLERDEAISRVRLDEIDRPMPRETCRVMELVRTGLATPIRPGEHHDGVEFGEGRSIRLVRRGGIDLHRLRHRHVRFFAPMAASSPEVAAGARATSRPARPETCETQRRTERARGEAGGGSHIARVVTEKGLCEG